jgi:hypothetical protein
VIRNFLNKMRQPQAQPIDPRARLAARVEIHHNELLSAETKYMGGFIDATALDRAKTNLADAQQALANFDATQEAAEATAARQAERGAAVRADAESAVVEITARANALEQALAKAKPILDEINRDFRRGVDVYAAPFVGTPLVERLGFWFGGVNVFHGGMWHVTGRFEERLAEYRRIGVPPAPVIIHRPTPETPAQKTTRLRKALENSRKRMRPVDGGGVAVEAA